MNLDEHILFYAFRYALGRMSYAVSDVVDVVHLNIDDISYETRKLMYEEIDDAVLHSRAGMDMDVREWQRLSAALKSANTNRA